MVDDPELLELVEMEIRDLLTEYEFLVMIHLLFKVLLLKLLKILKANGATRFLNYLMLLIAGFLILKEQQISHS